jgi:hypothetical protein
MLAEDKVALSFPFPPLNPKLIFSSSAIARNNDILKKLVLEAKREYEKNAKRRIHIFMVDT